MRRATAVNETGAAVLMISIHALHEESDMVYQSPEAVVDTFQSTLSMRRATTAPHAHKKIFQDFNPRSP